MLDVALVHWLPLLASRRDQEQQLASEALNKLTLTLIELHDDNWLRDLQTGRLSNLGTRGLLDLGDAVNANLAGDPERALRAARRAEATLKAAQNRAGWMRARMEEVYALQRHVEPRQCLAETDSMLSELDGLNYRWVDAQVALEQSICQSMLGEFALARKAVDRAIAMSEVSKYAVLQLRAMGIRASLDTVIGNTPAAWTEDRNGLIRYWKGIYPEQRAYQFYSDLSFVAQKENRWYAAAAFAREAALTIAHTANRSVEAIAWHRFGSLAQTAGLTSDAMSAFERANSIFNHLPQNQTTQTYRVDCEVNLAALQTQQGDLESPLHRLVSIKQDVLRIPDITIRLRFYQTLGRLYIQRGEYAPAEQAFRSALENGETALRSLKRDQDRLAWEKEIGKTYRGLVQLLFRWRQDPIAALRVWRRYQTFRPYAGQWVRAAFPTQQAYPDGITILTYAQLPDGIAAWVSDASGTGAHWVEFPAAALESLVDRFSERCSNPYSPLALLQQDGRELYHLLVEPFADRINRTSLLIVRSDGILKKLPMQALTDSAGHFLGLDHPIVISQGIRNGRFDWRSAKIHSKQHALVVGAPSIAPELINTFPPLSNAFQEAEFISKLFKHATLLTKSEATLSAVQDALKRAQVFHFAGHALFTTTSGGLLMAGTEPGSILDAAHLQRNRPHYCQLAVLSACSTETREEGMLDPDELVRTFLESGVNEVIAARWSIDSVATQSFMSVLYPAMLRNQSVPIALQQAGHDFMSQPLRSHPYYWAAFNVYVLE